MRPNSHKNCLKILVCLQKKFNLTVFMDTYHIYHLILWRSSVPKLVGLLNRTVFIWWNPYMRRMFDDNLTKCTHWVSFFKRLFLLSISNADSAFRQHRLPVIRHVWPWCGHISIDQINQYIHWMRSLKLQLHRYVACIVDFFFLRSYVCRIKNRRKSFTCKRV